MVVLQCPLTKENTRFVDARMLARMKRTAIVVNVAPFVPLGEHTLAPPAVETR